jgi:hypothetical protein
MVPTLVSPRRLELDTNGSSLGPTNLPYWIQQGGDMLRMQVAPHGENN